MKKLLVVIFAFIATVALAQEKKAPLSPAVKSEGEFVEVVYGQPSKKGRQIFGKLEPYGKVWRTGANKGTEVTFKKDVNFGGKSVKAGTYTVFTIPNETQWDVILNSELGQWGAYGYDKIKDKNVAVVTVPVTKLTAPEEKLKIDASGKDFIISWDDVLVSVPLKF